MATSADVDGRADLYAVGCVAYFLLTGRLVFEGGTPMQMITRRAVEDPLPPSQRTELPIPRDLEAVVLACLSRLPGDRPQSAAALDRALASVAVPPWTEDQAREWWAMNRPGERPLDSSETPTQTRDWTSA
jgi:serine/threonine-protein kinase